MTRVRSALTAKLGLRPLASFVVVVVVMPPAYAPAPVVTPIVVQLPVAQSPDGPVYLLADCTLVVATSFLEWEALPAVPGTPNTVSLSQWKMITSFLSRCSLSPDAADGVILDRANPLHALRRAPTSFGGLIYRLT